MEFTGTVHVQVGNTVNISCGEDPIRSRQTGYAVAKALLHDDAKGFDANKMQLVKPQTPFKPGSTERWPDKGLHVTAALEGRAPWMAADGTKDVITTGMAKVAGRKIQLSVDPGSWHFLEGSPANDEGTGLVFYLAAFLDAASRERVAALRTELGLGAVSNHPHLSLAGVAPADGDFASFRQQYCRSRPPVGVFPDPYPTLQSVME